MERVAMKIGMLADIQNQKFHKKKKTTENEDRV